MIETKSPNPFWWRKSVAPELAQNYSLGMPLPGTKPGERGFDAIEDMKEDVKILKELYTSGGKESKRLARHALQPLLLAGGVSPVDFDRQFPEVDSDPMPVEEAQDNLQKLNKAFDFMNSMLKPQR
jgi:hypothetical protein